MSLKIGQVNLISTEGGAAFNVMYKMDDAFRASPPADYGVAVYAGKKLLAACRNVRHSNLSGQYSGDLTSPQGYTNAKGIKDWQDAPRFTGLEEGRVAVNMYYASSAGPRENQLVGGAGSGGVHTIIAYADGKIHDAKVVVAKKAADLIDNQGTGFTTLNITGPDGMVIVENMEHDEADKLGTESWSAESGRKSNRSLEDKIDSLMEVNLALINLLKNKL